MAWDGSRPPSGGGGNPWWGTPDKENTNWRPPGNSSMFRDTRVPDEDDPKRAFTTKRRHGWWGKEERYDAQGNRMDGSGSRQRAWFFDEGE